MRRFRTISAFFGLYLALAAPVFLPGDWRLVVQPATPDAAEVYVEPLNWLDFWVWSVDIEPFNHALDPAEELALKHPRDLGPPYLIYERPFRLVFPYTTVTGKALAAAPITVWLWHDGRMNRYVIVPEIRRVRHGIGELRAIQEGMTLDEVPGLLSVGVDAEHNRVQIQANRFDQEVRRRLALAYGDKVAIKWTPFEEMAVLS